jgi:hypothetical protein
MTSGLTLCPGRVPMGGGHKVVNMTLNFYGVSRRKAWVADAAQMRPR